MPIRRLTFLLFFALLSIATLAQSAFTSQTIECADGSPCWKMRAPADDCCRTSSPLHKNSPCVIRSSPRAEFIHQHQAITLATPTLALADLPPPILQSPSSSRLRPQLEIPPPQSDTRVTRGLGARPPPAPSLLPIRV